MRDCSPRKSAMFNFSLCLILSAEAAGFTQEWSANLSERVARRQIEVQSTQSGNAQRSNEYRTVTAPDPSQQEGQEERK